ncbi:DUF4400 domain-containing protein [Noviherbaspirillum sedimenti]|uniref:DUF4400 domain-containing protein n=1 Tax=Noviherbaspirillum sedimenti TaxID=2320865 RepID=A0A3A3FWI5_9BURK|nr:DUF4400 domain-containing protein [Noviherbaspirillum sedimenti]RJG00578.1 DUF4400 domain-containing protein [Noviherbaspirillum sedimenti]
MIRFVCTASLVALLMLVLYLPAAFPPERFLNQLRVEHALTAEAWSPARAVRILARMLDLQATAQQASPIPPPSVEPPSQPVALDVAWQMAQANNRLFNSDYFRAIDTLFALATYRLCALVEWLPVLLAWMLAALFDGGMRRLIKSRAFIQHNPEIFALYACAAIVAACLTVVALVLPVTVPPLAWPLVPLAISVFASRALASFHRRA